VPAILQVYSLTFPYLISFYNPLDILRKTEQPCHTATDFTLLFYL